MQITFASEDYTNGMIVEKFSERFPRLAANDYTLYLGGNSLNLLHEYYKKWSYEGLNSLSTAIKTAIPARVSRLDLSDNNLGTMNSQQLKGLDLHVFKSIKPSITSLLLSRNQFDNTDLFSELLAKVPPHIIHVDLTGNSKLDDGKYKFLLRLPLSVQTVKINNGPAIIMKDLRAKQAAEDAKKEAELTAFEAASNINVEPKATPSKSSSSIKMKVLFGFTACLGIAAVALAFVVFNAAALSGFGLGLAGAGVATLIGLGIFAATCRKNTPKTGELTSIPEYSQAYARHHESLDDEGADSYGSGTM